MNHLNKSFAIFSFLLLAFLHFADPVFTQSVTEEWLQRYNGPGNFIDEGRSVAIDDSGNVYVTGASWGIGTNYDYATVKYNSSGVEQWVAIYNGPGFNNDVAHAIVVDNLGNVYVTGYSWGIGTNFDYATIKYNSSGVEQWIARYNEPSDNLDIANSIAIDASGNVYVTGRSFATGSGQDYATIKYNSSGVEQWVARYNGIMNGNEDASFIAVDGSGNVFVTGYTTGDTTGGVSHRDYATVKYNSSGVQQWVAIYNGPGNGNDSALCLVVGDSGNVYVTGRSRGIGTGFDYATLKYNSSGIQQWVARYNGPGNSNDAAHAIAVDNLENVYVTGRSTGIEANFDYATLKYNSLGAEQWVATYDGPASGLDAASSLAVDESGNVYVTGQSTGVDFGLDYATIKYNSSGVEKWVARYNGPGNSNDLANSIVVDGSGNVYVTGQSTGSGSGFDYATIKYSQPVSSVTQTVNSPGNYIFNDLTDTTTVSIQFSSASGSGNVTVSLYDSPPFNYSFPPERSEPAYISQYKWVITQTGLSGIDALVKFYTPEIPDNGITNINEVTIYSRPVQGSGTFSPLVTTISGDTLIAQVNGFSEFIFGSETNPLPVELASFTATVDSRDVHLNWTTASELNNSGFDIERKVNGSETWMKSGFVEGNGTTNEAMNYLFTDRGLNTGMYNYRLKQVDYNGNFEYFNLLSEVNVGVPDKYDLSQNYPNPFNPTTKINFDLPFDSKVTMKIFDLTGREIATLVNEVFTPGYYTIAFEAGNISSGVYFYRIVAEGGNQQYVMTKKMLMLK